MSQVISHQNVYICELTEVTRSDLPCNACPGESAPQILSSLTGSTLNFPHLPWRKIHSIRYAEPKISNFGVWALYLQASQWAGLLGESVITSGLSWMPAAASIPCWAGWYGLRFVKMQGGNACYPLFTLPKTPPQTLMWNAKMMTCRSLEAPLPAMRFWGCRYF